MSKVLSYPEQLKEKLLKKIDKEVREIVENNFDTMDFYDGFEYRISEDCLPVFIRIISERILGDEIIKKEE